MAIDGITLWVFGGVARFCGSFPSAGAEFRIAIAGPLVTLALAAVFLLISVAAPLPAAVDGVVYSLWSVNLLLLVFNLLPALPLDGGRVLRAALWQLKRDFAAATRTAAALGRTFGQVLVAGGVFLALFAGSFSGFWLALIGWFLMLAAQAEAQAAIAHVALAGLCVADAMVAAPDVVDADLPLQRFMDEVFARTRHTAYPVLLDGHPVGMLAFDDATALPRAAWPSVRAADRMRPIGEVVVARPTTPSRRCGRGSSAHPSSARWCSRATGWPACSRPPTSRASSRPPTRPGAPTDGHRRGHSIEEVHLERQRSSVTPRGGALRPEASLARPARSGATL